CENLELLSVAAGDKLLEQGASDRRIIVLSQGKLGVKRDDKEIAIVEEAGAIFGEISMILACEHTATVHAIEDSQIYIIEDPDAFSWEQPMFHFELLGVLARRLRRVTEHVSNEEKAHVEVYSQIEELVHQQEEG
ncbi:MAG: cyclic nucleotide-binding domain-containing protein, partial [Verrucomicrobiota bacterium]